MMKYVKRITLIFGVAIGCGGCQLEQSTPLFVKLPSDYTGINFVNQLTETPQFNFLHYLYFYNGGGVAVGDINNDGLQDLFFSANQEVDRLYLNKGNLQFEDITASAGLSHETNWSTGVAMTDINGDGFTDIYVCNVSGIEQLTGSNKLYLNQGDNTFKEMAAQYGLDFQGLSTQSAFLDYDRDGDLDMYLLNHSTHANDTYRDTAIRRDFHPTAGDRLFRNDGPPDEVGGGGFTEVTREARIYSSALGYGLGIAVSDVDNNGCPDIYIGNDFHEDDYLYLNQCDGTFHEVLQQAIGHTSQFTMGVDIADINEDGWADIFSLDMKPYQEKILKTAEPPNTYEIFQYKRELGYYYQYPHNALQLNQGVSGLDTSTNVPQFSEIAQLTGMDATDWSWSALWADYDNNGKKDVFITNGIYRRPNDMDYINFISDPKIARALQTGISDESLTFIEEMPQVKLSNRIYSQIDRLSFEEVSTSWGLDQTVFSNGATYVDLDNDGDLDLVTHNINEPAYIFENQTDSLQPQHYIKVKLKGKSPNTQGIGSKVTAYAGNNMWVVEQFPVRGFMSSVDPVLHIGLGSVKQLDSLRVIWPDGMQETQKQVSAKQTVVLQQKDATVRDNYLSQETKIPFFEPASLSGLATYEHNENTYTDFNLEPLMPHMLSRQGPPIARGDVNGDGKIDLFIGNAAKTAGKLFIQQEGLAFTSYGTEVWQADSIHEDTDAVFVDVDQDEDLDLYVVSGGNEFRGPYKPLKDRLYINDGKGNFTREEDRLPDMYENGACVRSADFDRDGDIDLFVGNRVVTGFYGVSPQSYLLENDGNGYFKDVTEEVAPGLARLGMVTDACWVDISNDDKLDLVVVGEWMPISTFIYKRGKLTENTQLAGLGLTNGFWNRIKSDDLDGDGDMDFIVGNLGLNSQLQAQQNAPCTLYLNDFDQNGSIDPVLCYFDSGENYPFAYRDELLSQIIPLKKKFPTYTSYAGQPIENLFTSEQLQSADIKYVYTFASIYLENKGDMTFELHELPKAAQIAPIYDILIADFDGDKLKDVILGGNFYGVGPNRGRYDASYGHFLKGNEEGTFDHLLPRQTGLWMEGEVRSLIMLDMKENGRYVVIGRNNDALQLFKFKTL